MLSPIDKNAAAINTMCQQHRVKALYAFGSVLTKDFNEQSDIDLIVDFEPIGVDQYADNYFELKFSLQHIFNRPVDLLEEKAISNPYFRQSISAQRKVIYEQ